MNESTLYRKVGKRYVRVGCEFVGWPCSGVWLVQETDHSKSSSVIMKVGDVLDPAPLAALARHRDVVAGALVEFCRGWYERNQETGPSISDFVQEVYVTTCKAEEERLAKERVTAGQIRQVHDENGMPVPINRTSSISAWMEGRKEEILMERMASLERKAEFNYYLARDDHDCSISWEMLTEAQRNVYRKQVGR